MEESNKPTDKRPAESESDPNQKLASKPKKPRKPRKPIEEIQCQKCFLFGHYQSNSKKCQKHPNYKPSGKTSTNEKQDQTGTIDDPKANAVVPVVAKEDFVHVCFDLETSGLSHSNNEIIEIYSATIHGKGKETGNDSFHEFIKPEKGVGNSHLIHGITDDDS